jgi:hypothetical protein
LVGLAKVLGTYDWNNARIPFAFPATHITIARARNMSDQPGPAVTLKRKYVRKAKAVNVAPQRVDIGTDVAAVAPVLDAPAVAPAEGAEGAEVTALTEGAEGAKATEVTRKRKYHRRAPLKPAGFLTKLRKMVEDSELTGIVSWNAAGNGILILNEDAFVSVVFPKYGFKTTRYSTFTRQLNLYQFVRVHSGKGTAEYANPSFLRDDLEAEAVRFAVGVGVRG